MRKELIITLLAISSFAAYAQNNNDPYAVFGHKSNITYEKKKVSDYFIIYNSDKTSEIKSMALNFDAELVLFLGDNDTILKRVNIKPEYIMRWLSPDPLADKAPSWSPYRFCNDNPVLYIDPTGLWEFQYNNDENGNTTNVQLVKQDGDNWKTFKEQTNMSRKELKQMFGKDFKNVLNSTSSFEMEQLGGKFAEMENAIVNLNKGDLTNNNCWGSATQMAETGKIDVNGRIKTSFEFDGKLQSYTNVSTPKTGDVIRYADPQNPLIATHGAVFLLQNDKGVQVFTKNGFSPGSTYEIMYQNTMLNLSNNPENPGGYGAPTGTVFPSVQFPYYRR